ncbi:biotin-dependent carboxyltransferase family protein [Paraglaciecola sp.]|uniref:5-oxoprolinase subunit C family protein n=1 Tax=Paraglaciecola sp. TaxID=1920173 RepID=UPI0030F3E373
MSIEVLKPGMQTSIQDEGREGYMHLGIARGGVMDTLSMQLANWLVGNQPGQPVLEVCLIGPTLLFKQALSIAITGARFELSVSDKNGRKTPVNHDQTLQLKVGDTLHFGKRIQGARAYLAFAAKLDGKPILGSYSTHLLAEFGGLHGRALMNGDVIPLRQCRRRATRKLSRHSGQRYSGNYLLRCTDSVESAQFSPAHKAAFYHNSYKLSSASNRMGLRLEGESLVKLSLSEMVSSGLTQGSVQIPPSGLPIISSVDGQTIGGYPRIANVISADLFALGQLVAGDHINFAYVSVQQAQELLFAQQKNVADWYK